MVTDQVGAAFYRGDLAYLREEALGNVLLFGVLGWYLWCAVLLPISGGFTAIWVGPVLMAGGLVTAWSLRSSRTGLAGGVALIGMASAGLYHVWAQGLGPAAYLLAVVVGLTGLLFDLRAVLAATALCTALVTAIGTLKWHYPVYTLEALAPSVVIGAVGVSTSLAVRNLYTALYWTWERTLAAQRSENELRERRAELVRTAKALDEACQRLEHLNYDLAQAREAAEEARLLKQQFTTNVSHELRTPLNVVVALSEMMYLSPDSYGGVALPSEYMRDVREIYRASQSLLRLIDDVLDLSQIERQCMHLHLEKADLAQALTEAAEIMSPLVRSKELQLLLEVPEDLPPVPMDRARVHQVLLNLLNNARRYTAQGTITLSARAAADHVCVTVADTGIGIAPADQERVFEEFRQVGESAPAQRDGSGLGLAISKRFVEMHGGRIWVESEGVPGRGSRFCFTLPLFDPGAPRSDLQRTGLALRPPAGRGRSLIVLGQDASGLRLLEQALPRHRLVPANDWSHAADLVTQTGAEAILVNGAGGSRKRWLPKPAIPARDAKSVPIIFCPLVTAQHLRQQLGVLEYLVKPISRASLERLLSRLNTAVRHILIIDDDPRMAQVLLRLLRAIKPACEVRCAHGGHAGLLSMRQRSPDLVLLDLLMPGMDGHAVLAKMRASPTLRQIPVAIITAQEQSPNVERRLSGTLIQLFHEPGYANEEALNCLRHILEALGPA